MIIMDCYYCGAELRPNAHFCNRCGTVQPASPPVSSPSLFAISPATSGSGATIPIRDTATADVAKEGVTGRPSAVLEEEGQADEGEEDTSLRVKRPPRVLRTHDQLDQEVVPAAELGSEAQEEDEDTRPSPAIRVATRPQVIDGGVPIEWAEAETVETEILPAHMSTTGRLETLPTDESPADEVATSEVETVTTPTVMPDESSTQTGLFTPHALSWPLPVSIIIGGRYRVETLICAAADEPDGENVYRVSDLKGYERCWSCGQEYGDGAEASDRFCRECGADMLGREYLMYERRIPEGGTTVAIDLANTTPEHPVAMGGVGMQEERTFTQNSRAYRVVPRVTEPSPFPHGAHILIGMATDVGRVRSGERNEDSLGALVLNLAHDSHLQPLALGIVADGLGGHVNGQDASRLVSRIVTEHILRTVASPLVSLPVDGVATEEGLKTILLESARAANTALCSANEQTGADMGSTLVAALVFGNSAYLINVGDSRGYVFSDGELHQITTDHSFVEQLIISGFVAPEDRYTHPQRNQILRSLGDDVDVEIDLFEQKLRPGMRFMLCSDGLWEMVRDDESARILRDAPDPQEACDQLVESANEHGGEDNISVVVIEVRN